MMSRRTFVAATPVAAAAVAAMPGELLAAASGKDPLHDLILINTLGGLQDGYGRRETQETESGRVVASEREIDESLSSGLTATNITLTASADFGEAVETVANYDAFVKAHAGKLLKVLSAEDIRRAKREKKIGLIYGFQNAAMLGDKVERVDHFAELGVRIIQLTYNDLNQLGAGSLVPTNDGLTPFGHQVVERLNARNLIIDLSHSGRQICLDAARASKRPISITHTGCAAVAPNPRNKSDEELRLVAEKGGYVGIYFMPFIAPGRAFSSDDVAAHIEHAVNICGEDHVGIGTDHAATDLGPIDEVRKAYGEIVEDRKAKGISAPGENPAILPYGTDLMGPDQFRVLARTLKRRGQSPARIEKIMGLNFLRYAEEIWG